MKKLSYEENGFAIFSLIYHPFVYFNTNISNHINKQKGLNTSASDTEMVIDGRLKGLHYKTNK